ncbi:uncharacterized protein LOC144053852 [Vanacampus margaritifer]
MRIEEKQKMATGGKKQLTLDRFFQKGEASTSAKVHVYDDGDDDGDNKVDAEAAALTRRQLRSRPKASEASGASAGKRRARPSTSAREAVESDDDEEYPESDGYSSEEWVQSEKVIRTVFYPQKTAKIADRAHSDVPLQRRQRELQLRVTLLRVSKIKVHRPVDPRKKIPKILAGMKQAGSQTERCRSRAEFDPAS